jgi:phosphatidylglycerol:prolipoprotein diacylglycerol transferase
MLIYPGFNPVALKLGPLAIRWYGLSYVAGMLGGLWVAKRLTRLFPARNLTPERLEQAFLFIVLGVILGGRVGYVLFYGWDHFLADPAWALRVWEGGMSFHGGALGVTLAIALFAWRHKIHPLDLADRIAPAVPIGLFFGRLANFINGELWGRPVANPDAVPWAMVFPRVDMLPRHPSQLYEAALEGLALGLLLYLATRHGIRRWVPTGLFCLGYAAARLIVEYFREPEITHAWGALVLTQGQLLSLPLAAFGLACLALGHARK